MSRALASPQFCSNPRRRDQLHSTTLASSVRPATSRQARARTQTCSPLELDEFCHGASRSIYQQYSFAASSKPQSPDRRHTQIFERPHGSTTPAVPNARRTSSTTFRTILPWQLSFLTYLLHSQLVRTAEITITTLHSCSKSKYSIT